MKQFVALFILVFFLTGCNEKPIKTVFLKIAQDTSTMDFCAEYFFETEAKRFSIHKMEVYEETKHFYKGIIIGLSEPWNKATIPKNPIYEGNGYYNTFTLWENGERVKEGKLVEGL